MVKLIVIWYDGTRDVHYYESRAKAEKVENGLYTAFGKQVEYTCVIDC